MSDHFWGDEDFDWKALGDCIRIVCKYKKLGFLGGQVKEKYGTLRWYSPFQSLSLHTLIYPGYVYSRFPKWLWSLDISYIGPFLRYFFSKLFFWWQRTVYNWIYQTMLDKHPHIRCEILKMADHLDLIDGASRQEGKKTYVLGEAGEILATWERL